MTKRKHSRRCGLAALAICLAMAGWAPAASAQPAEPVQSDVEEATIALFTPYLAETAEIPVVWERPVFTSATAALIDRWKAVVPEGVPGLLDGGDWLCQCRKWNPAAFRAEILTIAESKLTADVVVEVRSGGEAGAGADVAPGLASDAGRTATLRFARERGGWRLDDVRSDAFPKGIKQELRNEIARNSRR